MRRTRSGQAQVQSTNGFVSGYSRTRLHFKIQRQATQFRKKGAKAIADHCEEVWKAKYEYKLLELASVDE